MRVAFYAVQQNCIVRGFMFTTNTLREMQEMTEQSCKKEAQALTLRMGRAAAIAYCVESSKRGYTGGVWCLYILEYGFHCDTNGNPLPWK